MKKIKVAFITHYCTHYRIKTYETLAGLADVTYFFYSAGREWYWDRSHGTNKGEFKHEYLSGFQVGRTRIAPSLAWKLLVAPYDAYIKCINGKFALPVTYIVARLKGKPFVLWTGLWIRLQTRTHRLLWPVTCYIYRNADAIVTYGTHVAEFLEQEGVEPARIFSARHAVDNDAFNRPVSEHEKAALRTRLGIGLEDKVVLYVGRFVEVKGLSYLLEAFAEVKSRAFLVLAGQGPIEDALRRQAQQLGIADRTRFTGYVPTSETVPYYAIAWVHVLPSVTTGPGRAGEGRETWGLVVNEAFNQGVPSIASAATGVAAGGLVRDGETGLVVPERDSAALADAMDRMLTDKSLRHTLGRNARHRVAAWNNDAMAATFIEAIRFAAARKAQSQSVEAATN
jgi:glycosyltransferase involved in cell wall biosynthesis